jgi:hypothetical protein
VAQAASAPIVDMQAYLAQNEDRGFLWWDSVHLTSFGQRLFAERLLPELVAVLRGNPARAALVYPGEAAPRPGAPAGAQ